MVDRCKKNIVAVDLDGTLFKGSTLKRFFKFGFKRALWRGDLMTLAVIVVNVVKSRFGIADHRSMKHAVVRRLEKVLSEKDLDDFATGLSSGFNDSVVRLIESYKDSLIVLTTASPMSYASRLAAKAGIGEVCATETTVSLDDYIENRGEKKVDSLNMILKRSGLKLAVVITDHFDDIPLMRVNRDGDNILVAPSAESLELIRNSGCGFRIIKL